MPRCETCGNDYDKAFDIVIAGTSHTFDSFECAIQALAPTCRHCGCRVIGHGVEEDGVIYCGASCATQEGAHEVQDRSSQEKIQLA
jgi:Rieske Fe-S protein